MDLLLWRHAEAEDAAAGHDDLTRALTAHGRRQAAKMAEWLRPRLPKDTRILVSPALRAQQTAAALKRDFRTEAALAPGASAAALLRAAGWPEDHGAVLVVGHQPTLGEVAARLMDEAGPGWSVRKGALWWLRARDRGGAAEVVLHLVLPPELL